MFVYILRAHLVFSFYGLAAPRGREGILGKCREGEEGGEGPLYLYSISSGDASSQLQAMPICADYHA